LASVEMKMQQTAVAVDYIKPVAVGHYTGLIVVTYEMVYFEQMD
jgi:hypothetical protein